MYWSSGRISAFPENDICSHSASSIFFLLIETGPLPPLLFVSLHILSSSMVQNYHPRCIFLLQNRFELFAEPIDSNLCYVVDCCFYCDLAILSKGNIKLTLVWQRCLKFLRVYWGGIWLLPLLCLDCTVAITSRYRTLIMTKSLGSWCRYYQKKAIHQ